MHTIEILRVVCRMLTAALSFCYLYQIVYLFVPLFQKRRAHGPEKKTRYAILIAARNEEAVLPYLLDSIAAQNYPAELVTTYVVADNCTDRTAEVAARLGARVYRRFNRTEIGKGYALRYLLDRIHESGEYENYDAFLVFDADNLLRSNYLTEINRTCSDGYEAFCGYRNSKNYSDNWISAGYALWFLHECVHLNQARMLLGTTCAVSGTGFGFTRALLDRCGGWHFFTLTEDNEFNTWCATRGARIGYCPGAILYDEQPSSFRQSWRQRTRWVQGGMQIARRCSWDMLCGMARGGRTGYASFEMATLSFWGYVVSFAVMALTLTTTVLWAGWAMLPQFLLESLLGAYGSLWAVGLLTTVSEWKRIDAGTSQKILYLFTFPLFMMTYIPITISALFRKFQWQPIAHTVAVPVGRMASGE
ncbi:MAG: glycosyltransferase family 2 protein [Oscillospiraceae bacterium]|nr:glycosyltransferase family 2 protein [Oscillospiraceae bacterium]